MTQEEQIYMLKNKVKDLQFFIEDADKNYRKLSEEYNELQENYNETIKDLDNFVIQCETRGLWTKELTDFLDVYLKFFND